MFNPIASPCGGLSRPEGAQLLPNLTQNNESWCIFNLGFYPDIDWDNRRLFYRVIVGFISVCVSLTK